MPAVNSADIVARQLGNVAICYVRPPTELSSRDLKLSGLA